MVIDCVLMKLAYDSCLYLAFCDEFIATYFKLTVTKHDQTPEKIYRITIGVGHRHLFLEGCMLPACDKMSFPNTGGLFFLYCGYQIMFSKQFKDPGSYIKTYFTKTYMFKQTNSKFTCGIRVHL